MKQLFKYILLTFTLFYTISPTFAQKKKKQHTVNTSKKTKTSKTKKVTTSKKVKSAKHKVKVKVEQFDEVANLNTLLKNANADLKTNKSDSIPEKVVTILSAFKPQLKNVAKIGFDNASAQTDTNSLNLSYQVPSQNLSFQYRPISLVPRAYKTDSFNYFKKIVTAKVGYGNYLHQYLNLNFNTMDAYNNSHSFEFTNESVTGTHHLQSMHDLGINYLGDIIINNNNHIETQVFYKQSAKYRYGLVPDETILPFSNYRQNIFHSGASFSLMKYNSEHSLIHYKPSLNIEHFEGLAGATNNWLYFKSPMHIDLKHEMKLNFNISYSLNQFNPTTSIHNKNTQLRFDPSIEFNKLNSEFIIGMSPTVENSEFKLYPILEFKKKLKDTSYTLTAGWHTHTINNQYTSLVSMNPWIAVPTHIEMTTKEQKFVEVAVNAGKRLNYGFTFSLNNYKDLPLFNKLMNTNRNSFGLLYNTIFEKKATTIELEAQLRYQFSDKLLVKNNFKYIQFNSLEENAKPWGILPLTLSSTFSWIPSNKWIVDAGLQYWTGATVFNESSMPYDLKNTLILNAGFTYKLTQNWSTWIKGENLLDKPYERWADYPSLGVQLMAGVVYSFRK